MRSNPIPALLARWDVRVVLLAACYALSGHFALMLAIPPGYASPMFPPAGIALALFLTWGSRVWPGVLLGSTALNYWAAANSGNWDGSAGFLLFPFCIGLGAALQASIGAFVVRRFLAYPNPFGKQLNILKFVVFVAAGTCLVNALIGPLMLLLFGSIPPGAYIQNFWNWWIGDSIGVLITTPVLLVVFDTPKHLWLRRQLTVSLPLVIALAVSIWVFAAARNDYFATVSWYPSKVLLIALIITGLFGTVLLLLDSNTRAREEYLAGLREDEERFRIAVESAPNAMIMVDAHGTIALVNREAERLFGYARDEMLGKPVEILVPIRFRAAHPELRQKFFESLQARQIGASRDLYGVKKGGEEFPVEIGLNPIHTSRGAFVLSSIVDITERKRLAALLERHNQELKLSNEELDEFANIASHDLREPLRGISNYADFLLREYEDQLDEDGRRILQRLPLMTGKLSNLLDSLSKYSRVGWREMAVKAANLNDVVGDVLETLRPMLDEKRAQVRVIEKLPTLNCDAMRVGEVFRNLIVNAVKYNDSPERTVEIGVEKRASLLPPAPGAEARVLYAISIRDNGIGISDEAQQQMFKFFKRLHDGDAYGQGSGIGLMITKKIIERHGGRIWVESQAGQGSTFYFTLQAEE